MSVRTRMAAVLGTAAIAGAGVLFAAAPASAATSADCNPRDFGPMCYFFHSNYGGARAGIVSAVDDLYAWTFAPGTGSGAGQAVANNSGSGSNRDSHCQSQTWSHVNGTGNVLTLTRYAVAGYQNPTLGQLNNDNRSLRWLCG